MCFEYAMVCMWFFENLPPTKVPHANQPPSTKFTRLLESTGSPLRPIKRTISSLKRVLAQVSVDIGSPQRLEPKKWQSHLGQEAAVRVGNSLNPAKTLARQNAWRARTWAAWEAVVSQSNGSAKKRNPVPRTASSKLFSTWSTNHIKDDTHALPAHHHGGISRKLGQLETPRTHPTSPATVSRGQTIQQRL